MFVALFYTAMIVNEAYSYAYVGNICPSLDMVLLFGWIVYMCLPGTEVCTAGLCSGVGCYLDEFCL